MKGGRLAANFPPEQLQAPTSNTPERLASLLARSPSWLAWHKLDRIIKGKHLTAMIIHCSLNLIGLRFRASGIGFMVLGFPNLALPGHERRLSNPLVQTACAYEAFGYIHRVTKVPGLCKGLCFGA